jgi:hypothetical protein
MPLTPEEGQIIDRLSRGEAIPGAPGTCLGCHHAKVWHNPRNRIRECTVEGCECARLYERAERHNRPGVQYRLAGGQICEDGDLPPLAPPRMLVAHACCTACGFTFPRPQARATCKVQAACDRRKAFASANDVSRETSTTRRTA